MKVLDLQCGQRHVFEGWFASEDDFVTQLAARMIVCPLCDDHEISKRLSAPRLNLGALAPQSAPPTSNPDSCEPNAKLLVQQLWAEVSARLVEQTENVGDGFPEEARRIHYGETTDRPIRGHASPAQTKELLDEGIEVLPLLLPEHLRQPSH